MFKNLLLFLVLTVPTVMPLNANAKSAQECLATAIYHESRSLAVEEQKKVGKVILNRVEDERFPSTVCGVVYEINVYKIRNKGKIKVKRVHQFSWTSSPNERIREPTAYDDALSLAEELLSDGVGKDFKALFFSKPTGKQCNKKDPCHRFR